MTARVRLLNCFGWLILAAVILVAFSAIGYVLLHRKGGLQRGMTETDVQLLYWSLGTAPKHGGGRGEYTRSWKVGRKTVVVIFDRGGRLHDGMVSCLDCTGVSILHCDRNEETSYVF